jgi:hypothetical protein
MCGWCIELIVYLSQEHRLHGLRCLVLFLRLAKEKRLLLELLPQLLLQTLELECAHLLGVLGLHAQQAGSGE